MPPTLFTVYHLLFLETKRNVIIDGNFTKVMYSNNDVVLNAIYLQFPIVPHHVPYVNYVTFPSDDSRNQDTIQAFERIERQILQYYQTYYACQKTPVFTLSNQLQRGGFKVYRGIAEDARGGDKTETGPRLPTYFDACTLKISGVWETHHQIGITFKFITNVGGFRPTK